jgi:predicted transcriptional regulator
MNRENCPVLSAVVERYDRTGEPVSLASVTEALGREEEAVASKLTQLAACELLATAGDGYRPTVTGREFLALDVDCGPFIVDVDESG